MRVTTCLLLAALLLTGCKAPWSGDGKLAKLFSLDSSWPWGDDDEPEEGIPVRLVGTWVDTVLNQAGKPSQRGFGGRVIFYGKDSEKPILVDGQLVVYAFDETNREPTDNRPTRRYVFPADQVARRMSVSELGPSYSFWLPWDEVGGPQTEISLVARFEPKDGPVVVGEQTRHVLPGRLTPSDMAASHQPPKLPEGVPSRPALPQLATLAGGPSTPASSQVQQASYDGSLPIERPRRMTTTSISLPDHFGRRIGPVTAPTASAPPAPMPANVNGAAAPAPSVWTAPAAYQPLSAGLPPKSPSPFAGRPTYGGPQIAPGFAPSQLPRAPQMFGGQVPTDATESQWTTTVSYSPAAGGAGQAAQAPPPSVGSLPPQPAAPATPAAR